MARPALQKLLTDVEALLCLAGGSARRQEQSWLDHPRSSRQRVEAPVAEALAKVTSNGAASQTGIRSLIDRVTVGRSAIQIQLSEVAEAEAGERTLTLPWTPPSPYRKREIIRGANDAKTYTRPMRANARAIVVSVLCGAHRGLDELLSDPRQTLESLALREDKTERSIRMTLALAFLAPDIVKAAVEGRLPRGCGLRRLTDPPMAWPDQWRALGARGAGAGLGTTRRAMHSCLAVFPPPAIHPFAQGQASIFEPTRVIRNRARRTPSKQHRRKRKFAARGFRRDAPGVSPCRRRTIW